MTSRENPTPLQWGLIAGGAAVVGVVAYLVARKSSPANPTTAASSAPTPASQNASGGTSPVTVNMPTAQPTPAPTVVSHFRPPPVPVPTPGPQTTFAQVLNGDTTIGLTVGQTVTLSPSPLTPQMTAWTAQFCPNCRWVANIRNSQGVVSLGPGGGAGPTEATVLRKAPAQFVENGYVITAVGSGSADVAFVYADPSGNPVGARYTAHIVVSA